MFCIGHSPSNTIEVSREETVDLDDKICYGEYDDDEEEGSLFCLDKFFQALNSKLELILQ